MKDLKDNEGNFAGGGAKGEQPSLSTRPQPLPSLSFFRILQLRLTSSSNLRFSIFQEGISILQEGFPQTDVLKNPFYAKCAVCCLLLGKSYYKDLYCKKKGCGIYKVALLESSSVLLIHIIINPKTIQTMITVKVKLRPSLVSGKKCILYYQLNQRNKTRKISTPIRLNPEDWDELTGRVLSHVEDYEILQKQIDNDLQYLHRLIERMSILTVSLDVSEVVACYKQTQTRKCVLAYMADEIKFFRQRNRLVTALNYEHAMNSFAKYLGGDDIPFTLVNDTLIEDYEVYLMDKGLVRNSVSFYMRILRAVYNKAVKRNWVFQTFPFQNVYTGIDHTQKRAISEHWISKLYNLELEPGSSLELARDMFIFSFCTRGMAFVDMAHLRKSNIKQGHIYYFRHKTHQPLTIRVESEIKRLLDKYTKQSPKSEYVFPILKGENTATDFNHYYIALNRYNQMLKKLSLMIGYGQNLTSYVARHSWATSARNHQIPLSVISAGLGHESEKTTEIYLKRLENSVVDSANRKIIKGLLRAQ